MFDAEELDKLLLRYLDSLRPGMAPLGGIGELSALPSRELLDLALRLPDEVFLLYVQVLKRQGSEGLFTKLMGEHEEENRSRVDAFFKRYMGLVLEPAESIPDYNPLLYYIPAESFQDLGFVQSREPFFKRQTIAHINEFLATHFAEAPVYAPGEQENAWNFFFGELLKI